MEGEKAKMSNRYYSYVNILSKKPPENDNSFTDDEPINDDHFPIHYLQEKPGVVMKRIIEVISNPVIFERKTTLALGDIVKSQTFPNAAFLSAVALMAEQPFLIKRLFQYVKEVSP